MIPSHEYALWIAVAAVLVNAVYVGIALLQWRAIKRQADITQAQSQHLVNAERPWLLVSNPQNKRGSSPGEKSFLVFHVTNYGQTPAIIMEVGGTAKLIGALEELPPKPEYGKVIFYNSRPLAIGMESGDIYIEYDPAIRDGKALLTGFGFVKYRGPFGGNAVLEYETNFSYCFYGYGDNRPCGLPGYNKHT